MCGIAGIIAGTGRSVSQDELAALSESLMHRGPDGAGACGWTAGHPVTHSQVASRLPNSQVAFAHRRLAIIDTGSGGHQPMATPDGRHVIVTNGEIYNYVELRRELEAAGVSFRSQSDTEVLLQALVHWGVARTLPRLVGMFAFALLDAERGRVTLARDPFGIKPLVWTMRGGDLVFASEPNAILRLSGVARDVDPQALYDYLRFGLTDRGDRTLFARIKHLPPGHHAEIDTRQPAGPTPVRYWQARVKPVLDISFEDASAELRRLFLKSVHLHLRADVPVGAALSGGIDSSAVVAAMRRLQGEDLDLHSFTFTSPGDALDEERWADMAGQAARAKMHKAAATGDTLARQIDQLIGRQGEPFGSTSVFAQDQVYGLVKSAGIKVTVDGQGADEILAGYLPFIAARVAGLIGRGRLAAAWTLVRASANRMAPGAILTRAARYLLPESLQSLGRWVMAEELVPAWMDGAWLEAAGVRPAQPQRRQGKRVLTQDLVDSLGDRVLPSLLRYQDRNSMAHSVESRVPFLTTELVEFAHALPEDFLIGGNGETKSVFRHAMRGLVPDAILDRPDKIGFITPQDTWLRDSGGWLAGVLKRETVRAIPAFSQGPFQRAVDVALKSNNPLPPEVWRWANLIRWAETFDARFAT